MVNGKARIVVEQVNGVLSYETNISVLETLGLLEGTKFHIIRNASGGPGRPNGDVEQPAGSPPSVSGRSRAAGFEVRRVDS